MNRSSLTRRQSASLLAAAVASVASASFTSSPAHASMLVDLRLAGLNGDANSFGISGDRKTLSSFNIGDTITINVVVRISGTNATQTVGNFDNANPTTDTRNDDAMQALVGAFSSVGPLKGNFDNSDQGNGNQVFPWGAPGSQNGVAQDFDSDGDLDLGATGTDPTNMWVARAGAQEIPTVSKKNLAPQTRFGVSIAGATGGSAAFNEDVGGPNTNVPDTRIIDATTAETLIGELTFIITGGAGVLTTINFIPRTNAEAGALWFEDGITTGKNGTNSPFGVGAPVTLGFPEPSSLALTGLAALGFLARRRDARKGIDH